MTNRRKMLGQLAAGVAVIPSVALGASAFVPPDEGEDDSACDCPRPLSGPHADYFPNLVVYTHERRRALFYNDLLRGKRVLINCMSLKSEAVYPVTEILVKVQRLLGNRLGLDVFMYSLTLDPEHDTPRALSAFAKRHGVKPGWLFLTGQPDVLEALRGRLFFHGGGHQQHGRAQVADCSRGLIRYGNEAVGLWGAVPVKTEPERIIERLSWVETRKAPVGLPLRKGPHAPAANKLRSQKPSGRQ